MSVGLRGCAGRKDNGGGNPEGFLEYDADQGSRKQEGRLTPAQHCHCLKGLEERNWEKLPEGPVTEGTTQPGLGPVSST